MNIPKELYCRFSSHRVAQFFLYLLFTSDDDGNVRTTLRQMAKDNEFSTWRVSSMLKELKTLGACQTETKQKPNNGKSTLSICNYEFYNKTLGACQTETKQKPNNGKSTLSICNYEFYNKTLGACQTETKQKPNENQTKKKVIKKNSFDYSFVEPDLQKPFEEWLKYKRSKNQMYKRQCDLELCYKKLKKYSDGNAEKAALIIEQSMTNNWSGLFELKTSTPSTALKSSEMNYDKDSDW